MKKKSLILFMSVLFVMTATSALADITVGIFPRRDVSTTHKIFKPLTQHLSQEMGEKVVLDVPKDFSAFWKALGEKKYDVVHFNQYHYLRGNKEFGYRVIVSNKEQGSKQIAGALSVRKDSGINTLDDLRGKTILFGGGKKAMGSYIAPTAILKKAGLNAEVDYKVTFAKNPPNAVIAVFSKAADAAGSGNVILKLGAVKKKVDVSQMKILAESEPFVQLPWAVHPDMSDAKMKKIQTLMVNLKDSDSGKEVLTAAKVNAFYAVSDVDFIKVKEIVEFVLDETY
jgi:phosphonate transport system substrate-binding protein